MTNLRGIGDVLKTDPHKKMLKRSKKLAKTFGKKSSKKSVKKLTFEERTEGLEGYEAAGAMFSADAWKAD